MSLVPLALFVAVTDASNTCPLLFPVAGDVGAARRIAETIIRNVSELRPRPRHAADRTAYILRVEPDWEGTGQWVAFQALPPPPPPRHRGEFIVQAGGGGLEFRIDRCTGAISRMHYSR